MLLPSPSENNPPPLLQGVVLLAFTTISWGGLLQIAKPLLATLDPVWLNGIRYAISVPIFAIILVLQEGHRNICFEGHGIRLALVGTIGFAGFGIVTLLGLQETQPELAALIVAMMPLVTALLNWFRGGERPSLFTASCIFLGLIGVLLTASQGHPSRILEGQVGRGPLLVFIGVTCWAFYTQSAVYFPSWSPLRYTSLSGLASLPSFALIVVLTTAVGWSDVPYTTNILDTGSRMAYIIVIATLLAMFAWNAGIRQLGPLNGVLFINLVPISAFTIGVLRGQHFSLVEWLGAMLVCLSLVASNLYAKIQRNRSGKATGMNRKMSVSRLIPLITKEKI